MTPEKERAAYREFFINRILPDEWPRGLPFDEAAFVCEQRIADGDNSDVKFLRKQRDHLRRVVESCRQTMKCINDLHRDDMLNWPIVPLFSRLMHLYPELNAVAEACEKLASGNRGRPQDDALRFLITMKYKNFQKQNPGKRGYRRINNEYHGPFIEQMENILARLGYPAQSRDALGAAIEQALCE